MKKRVVVTGATGFIGSHLCKQLALNGYHVLAVGHNAPIVQTKDDGVTLVAWDGMSAERLLPYVDGAYGIVNLAGESIHTSNWTEKKKKAILESRVNVGKALLEAVKKSKKKPLVFIQASAIGCYPDMDQIVNEETPVGNSFLAAVCKEWEASTRPVERMGVRHVVIRSAPVLGNGGMLARILKPFRWGLGGTIASGSQWFSFIHIQDELDAIQFLLEEKKCRGIYNLSAPQPVQNREFTAALASAVHRPAWFGVSGLLLRARYWQMAEELLLASHRVVPNRLLQAGFIFSYPTITSVFDDLLEGKQ